jgi:hypothetical protein
MAHSMTLLECSKNVIFGVRSEWLLIVFAIVDDERKGGPAIQALPDRCSICAEKLEVETGMRCKNDLPPSSTDMYESVPLPYGMTADLKKAVA